MKLKKIMMATALMLSVSLAKAQDCEMAVAVVLDEDFSGVPAAAGNVLYHSLMRIATTNGLSTDDPASPFVLTAHCDVIDKYNEPGPPMRITYNLGVTFYMADINLQKKFGTAYITLNGVGENEAKSYINAFKNLNGKNAEIAKLIRTGKQKMMAYYNSQYRNIIKEAQRLESQQKYEQALALVMAIPVCSEGGDAATDYGVQLYTKNLDRMNLYLLNTAGAIWAAGQDADAAAEACKLLAQIDPDAACYNAAASLMSEIKKQVRKDIDFEMRDKYNDTVDIEKQRIAAARAVGVAYGNGQKAQTTNLMWLR